LINKGGQQAGRAGIFPGTVNRDVPGSSASEIFRRGRLISGSFSFFSNFFSS
jgi:hypothetical protein